MNVLRLLSRWKASAGAQHTGLDIQRDFRTCSLLDKHDRALVQKIGLTDIVLLYFTLLADKVVPSGFLPEFVTLEASPTGWHLLEKEAPYSRDSLLPARANNYRGFKKKGAKVPNCLRYPIPFVPRAEDLPIEYGALLHAP